MRVCVWGACTKTCERVCASVRARVLARAGDSMRAGCSCFSVRQFHFFFV